jgi:hypothetical protein
MEQKDYVHSPLEVVKTQLIRGRQLRELIPVPKFYELAKDGSKTELKNYVPQRKFEFACAGEFYLDDIAKILCTHFQGELFLDDEVYIRSVVGRDKFFTLARGEYKDQDEKIIAELGKMENRRCYVPAEDGSYYLMPPYLVVPKSISLKEFNALPSHEKRALLNIKKTLEVSSGFGLPSINLYMLLET